IDLSTNNYPMALEVNPNINPLHYVANLLLSLGLNLKAFGLRRPCRPGEARGVPSNDIFNDLSSDLRVLDETLLIQSPSVLGADLASQDLIIESIAQQSVLIECEIFLIKLHKRECHDKKTNNSSCRTSLMHGGSS